VRAHPANPNISEVVVQVSKGALGAHSDWGGRASPFPLSHSHTLTQNTTRPHNALPRTACQGDILSSQDDLAALLSTMFKIPPSAITIKD
jgi:hypothetical protein